MCYTSTYTGLCEKLMGREPTRADGTPASDLARCEGRLKLKLPLSMREFYRAVGRCRPLCNAHDDLWSPDQFEIDSGYLVFMEENQAVVHWGVPLAQIKKDDPVVWQRVNCESPEWHSERMRFSVFMARRLKWALGGHACGEERSHEA
jgi:hypothetical protein